MLPNLPKFTILIGSIGRPTIRRTIDSFVQQEGRLPGDQLIITLDTNGRSSVDEFGWVYEMEQPGVEVYEYDSGYHHLGVEQINWAWVNVPIRGTHIFTIGDDDIFVRGAFARLRDACGANPERPVIYQFLSPWRTILPDGHHIAIGRISGCCIAAPRRFNAAHPTDRIPEHDFHWIQGVVERAKAAERGVVWLDEVLVVARPNEATDALPGMR